MWKQLNIRKFFGNLSGKKENTGQSGSGRALTKLISTGSYQTIDISDFSVERVLGNNIRLEPYVL